MTSVSSSVALPPAVLPSAPRTTFRDELRALGWEMRGLLFGAFRKGNPRSLLLLSLLVLTAAGLTWLSRLLGWALVGWTVKVGAGVLVVLVIAVLACCVAAWRAYSRRTFGYLFSMGGVPCCVLRASADARRAGVWRLTGHVARRSRAGIGKAMRLRVIPELATSADAAHVEVELVAASEDLAAVYQAESDENGWGLQRVERTRLRGVRMVRRPHDV